MTCLIFRRDGDIEMRHQRSADCEFDFIKPAHPRALTEEKPLFLYEVVEALLPQALPSSDDSRCRLLELWAQPNSRRRGWLRVSQRSPAEG